MRKPALLWLPAAGLVLALGGCINIDESLSLNRDLSGKSSVQIAMDYGAAAPFIANIMHSISGGTGGATPAEIDAVRQQMADEGKKDSKTAKVDDPAAQRRLLEEHLPPGVKLISGSVDAANLKVSTKIEVSFDDVQKLAQIKLPADPSAGKDKTGAGSGSAAAADADAAPSSPMSANPYESPFSGLKVVDEGKTILVQLTGIDPATRIKQQKQAADMSPEMMDQMAAVLGDAHFAFKLETPFDVVETNATRRDGRTLYWYYKFADMIKAPQTLMARFKKK